MIYRSITRSLVHELFICFWGMGVGGGMGNIPNFFQTPRTSCLLPETGNTQCVIQPTATYIPLPLPLSGIELISSTYLTSTCTLHLCIHPLTYTYTRGTLTRELMIEFYHCDQRINFHFI